MTSPTTLTRLIAMACLGGVFPSVGIAQTIVWADQDALKIQRKDVSGGAVQTIVQFPFPQFAQSTRYDPIAAKLYYRLVSGGTSVIQRSNIDGSNPETIPIPTFEYFTLNIAGRKLHWTSSNGTTISSSELNGTGIMSHTYSCCVFTLEGLGDRLFFGAGGVMQKGIWRADADGSNEQFMSHTSQPKDIAYDPFDKKLYVGTIDGIYRTSTDGSDLFAEVIHFFDATVPLVEVDSRGRKLYWVDSIAKAIRRSNLDGSNVEDFVTAADVGNPNFEIEGLTVVDAPSIPAMSGWGVVATVLLILVLGMIILKKRTARISSPIPNS